MSRSWEGIHLHHGVSRIDYKPDLRNTVSKHRSYCLLRRFRYDQFSPSELQKLCHLRAIEWVVWPAFLSQPVLPILYLVMPVYEGLLLVFIASLLWVPIRYRFASLQLATLGCFWEALEWLTIPTGVMVLLFQKRYVAALFALGTPLVVGLLGIPGKIGIVEARFYVQSAGSESILR